MLFWNINVLKLGNDLLLRIKFKLRQTLTDDGDNNDYMWYNEEV